MTVLVIVIIVAIVLWRRKVNRVHAQYNINNADNNHVPRFHEVIGNQFAMGAYDVDPLIGVNTQPVDIGERQGEVPELEQEEEQEHEINIDEVPPELMELEQENTPIAY